MFLQSPTHPTDNTIQIFSTAVYYTIHRNNSFQPHKIQASLALRNTKLTFALVLSTATYLSMPKRMSLAQRELHNIVVLNQYSSKCFWVSSVILLVSRDTDTGNPNSRERNVTLSTTWTGLGMNPGLRGERPATNRLNHYLAMWCKRLDSRPGHFGTGKRTPGLKDGPDTVQKRNMSVPFLPVSERLPVLVLSIIIEETFFSPTFTGLHVNIKMHK